MSPFLWRPRRPGAKQKRLTPVSTRGEAQSSTVPPCLHTRRKPALCASRQNPFRLLPDFNGAGNPGWVSRTHPSFPKEVRTSKRSFGIVVPLVSSVTGGPVPAYISAGGSKAVTVPAPADAAFSPWRHLSEALPGQRPFLSLFQNGNNIALASAVVKGAPRRFSQEIFGRRGNFRRFYSWGLGRFQR